LPLALAVDRSRGGKLITTHGWTDPIVPVASTLAYRAAVIRYMGQTRTDAFFRTFLAPGVDHCGGGPGADRFTMSPGTPSPKVAADHDLLEALVALGREGEGARAHRRVEAGRR
jgi:feruloyl esterase